MNARIYTVADIKALIHGLADDTDVSVHVGDDSLTVTGLRVEDGTVIIDAE